MMLLSNATVRCGLAALAFFGLACLVRPSFAQRPGAVPLEGPWLLQDIAQAPQGGAVISRNDFTPTIYQPKPYISPTGKASAPTSPDWYRATVPGTVLTTLVDNHLYPDPLFGENNRPDIIPDSLCRTSYWYRTSFPVPTDFKGRHIWLTFEGINYTADIWINGQNAGTIKGAFTRGNFDITSLVTPGEPSTLAVLIHPPPHPNTPNEHTIAAGVGPNGGNLHSCGGCRGSPI